MPDAQDPFYVGYLPLPERDRGFLRRFLPAALAAIAGLGLAIARGQKDPGDGQWALHQEISLEGTVTVNPYAVLYTQDAGVARAVLLVEEGKFGAAERMKPLAGGYVKIRGTLLHRDGRNMLEIADSDGAVQAVARRTATIPAVETQGVRTLRGEVIDPKCYLGAMKPGGGKTHKACAELCMAGGIPPMLAVWEKGHEVFYLLEHADGTAANQEAAPFAGETVRLTGEVEQHDDLRVLRIHADGWPRQSGS
jgi:hypothetical protein